jgi:acyl-CoA synthetase (AMP-forming)/AMP-acid ligase II
MKNPEGLSIRSLILEGNQDPDHPALEAPGCRPLTYRDLREQIISVVSTLNAYGIGRNDRIAVVTPPGPETAVLLISVMAGSTAVCLNCQYTKTEYENYFSLLKVRALIVQKGAITAAPSAAMHGKIPVIELVSGIPVAGLFTLGSPCLPGTDDPVFAEPSDTAAVMLTSGTTALSKVVPKTHHQQLLTVLAYCSALGITRADKNLHFLPFDTGLGIGTALMSSFLQGGSLICPRDFIPSDFPDLLITHRPTYYFASPAYHHAIVQELKKIPPEKLQNHSLRFIVTGTAAMPGDIRFNLQSLLKIPVIEAYGSSETGGAISINIPEKQGSAGRPIIEHLEIWNEDKKSLGPCEHGEIVVRGETVFSGYENAPEENAEAFSNGWYRTGDTGYLDEEGYLFLTGRIRELINKGGRKISPAEIDAALLLHPRVRDAMSFPIPDPVLGEDIGAMVVRSDCNLSEHDLRAFLLDRLIPSKIPRKFLFVDDIPKNTLGKPLRHKGTARFS